MQGGGLKRWNRSVTFSPAERILMTVILWGAIVGLAAIVTAYLLAALP